MSLATAPLTHTGMSRDDALRASSKARAAAVTGLIRAHQEEFDLLHGDARERNGLPRQPINPRSDVDRMRQRIARQTAKLDALREQLDALT